MNKIIKAFRGTKFGQNTLYIEVDGPDNNRWLITYNPWNKRWYNVNTKQYLPDNFTTSDGFVINKGQDYAVVSNLKNSQGYIRLPIRLVTKLQQHRQAVYNRLVASGLRNPQEDMNLYNNLNLFFKMWNPNTQINKTSSRVEPNKTYNARNRVFENLVVKPVNTNVTSEQPITRSTTRNNPIKPQQILDVADFQNYLMSLGYKLNRFGADGKWGRETLAAYDQWIKNSGNMADYYGYRIYNRPKSDTMKDSENYTWTGATFAKKGTKLVSRNPILRFKEGGNQFSEMLVKQLEQNDNNFFSKKKTDNLKQRTEYIEKVIEKARNKNEKVAMQLLELWNKGAFKGVINKKTGKEVTFEEAVDGISGTTTNQAQQNYLKIQETNSVKTTSNKLQSSYRTFINPYPEMNPENIEIGYGDSNLGNGYSTKLKTETVFANLNPATRLASAVIHGLVGYSPTYTNSNIPNSLINVLSDLSLYIFDNFEKALLANIYALQSRIREKGISNEEKSNYKKEIENILNLMLNVKKAGGFRLYLMSNPGKQVRVAGNMAHYKNANYSRFGNSSIPTKYANFEAPNYGNYALSTPLGLVENIYGENLQYFTYNPETNQIETLMTDIYDFNPYGSAGESNIVKGLRLAAGNSKILGRTAGKYNIKLKPISLEKDKTNYLSPEGFTGNKPIKEDSDFLKWIMSFGKDHVL